MKPRAPVITMLSIATAFHSLAWAYPILQGGPGNIAGFVVWGVIILGNVCGLIVLFIEVKPPKHRPAPWLVRFLIRTSALCAMGWLVWNGEFVLSGLWILLTILSSIHRVREREAESIAA